MWRSWEVTRVCATRSGTSVNLAGGARGPRPVYFFTALALLVALGLGPLFAYLPRFALAVVVMMAVADLLDVRRVRWRCVARTGSTRGRAHHVRSDVCWSARAGYSWRESPRRG